MVKKSLIAVVVALLLVTTVNAGIDVTGPSDVYNTADPPAAVGTGVKAEGSDYFGWEKTFYWPHTTPTVTWEYNAVAICTIPVKMEIGMYIEIVDCKDKEILLKQVDCGNAADFPCYAGFVIVHAVSNFNAVLGLNTTIDNEDVLSNLSCDFDGSGSKEVPNDGNETEVKITCSSTKAKLYKGVPGTVMDVATVVITVKPASGY